MKISYLLVISVLLIFGNVFIGDAEAMQSMPQLPQDQLLPPPPVSHSIEEELFITCRKGDLEKVRYLAERGVSIKEIALPIAAESGSLELIKYLVEEKGLDVNEGHMVTALMRAAKAGSLEVVKYLVEKGAVVDKEVPMNEQTALMYAAQAGSLEVVKYLVEKGADVNARETDFGDSVLRFAKNDEIRNFLKSKGAHY